MRRKRIELTIKQRAELKQYCSKGVHNVRLVNRAKIILALDQSGGRIAEKQEMLAERIGVSRHAWTLPQPVYKVKPFSVNNIH